MTADILGMPHHHHGFKQMPKLWKAGAESRESGTKEVTNPREKEVTRKHRDRPTVSTAADWSSRREATCDSSWPIVYNAAYL